MLTGQKFFIASRLRRTLVLNNIARHCEAAEAISCRAFYLVLMLCQEIASFLAMTRRITNAQECVPMKHTGLKRKNAINSYSSAGPKKMYCIYLLFHASIISCAWFLDLGFAMIFLIFPFSSIKKVVRYTPMYLLPNICFSPHTP